jgi:hypothetical protein
VGKNGRYPRAHVISLPHRHLAHPDSVNIRDGVVLSGREDTYLQSDLPRSWSFRFLTHEWSREKGQKVKGEAEEEDPGPWSVNLSHGIGLEECGNERVRSIMAKADDPRSEADGVH